jgi:putative oxidoreductase
MPPVQVKPALALLARLGLGALFVIAGVLKLREPTDFATAIANYQLWPQLAAPLAAALPSIEIVVGLAVLIAPRPWRAGAAAAIALLMLMFTVATASAVVRGIDVACGCFGTESGTITGWTIGRDLALLAVAGWLAWWEERAANPRSTSSGR